MNCNQFLTVYQPRFEDGKVSRCIGDSLQLSVYEHTDIVLFLTGQFEIFDLFETAPKGCITAVWKVTEASTSLVCPFDKVSCQDPAIARRDQVIEANATPHAKARRSSLLQDTKRKSTIDSKRLQQVETNLEQATPPAAVREAGAAVYEVSPLDPPTDHDANPQCAATAKRGLSSLEALVRKVPVPKLPGADNRYKTLAGRLEENLVLSSQPIEQFEVPYKEQGKGQASDAAIERSDSGLPSRGVNHPLSNTPHDALLLTKDKVVDYVDDCVAPTQIDIESTGDSCHMNQEETSISLRNFQGDACHADNHSPKENKTKEAETGLCHLKEKGNVRFHCQTLQPILPGTTGTVHPIQDQPFKSVSAEEARQFSQHPPIEPDLSCVAVSTVGNNMHDTHAATKVTQEIDCSLDDSIIKEIDMQDAKEPTEGAKDDGAKYHVDEQVAPKIDTTSHDKGIWPAQNVEPEQEIRKSKSVINLLEDTIAPTFGNLSFSLTERRILAHLHTLKQLVASKVSLVNMEFGEEDLTQAAKLYDNLNATACFYTTALRLLSKADWQEPVDFEDHIVHQAMIAVARGWTTAVGVKTLPFDKHYLALSMATLPSAAHGEVKRTFDSIVATLPSPFKEKASSKVVFTCRVCGKKASHDVPTFIVLEPIISQASGHEFFNAAVPWTENLLPGSAESLHDSVPNCHECASDSSWIIEAESKCKLVWFQFPREFHPQALQYATFIGKDPFFVRGLSWKCVSVVIHQGRDPLYGENQPAEHFYVLENEGPKCNSLCYNNAVGLHHIDDTKIRPGDRICALLFRTTDITTKWPIQCTLSIKRIQKNSLQKQDKGKRSKNGRISRVLLSSKKRTTLGKQPAQQVEISAQKTAQDTYTDENYGPPEDEVCIVPIETIDYIEDIFSQSQTRLQGTLAKQQGNSDPCRFSSSATGAPQRLGSSPTRPGPYTTDNSKSGVNYDRASLTTASAAGESDVSKPPYAILSMFDGCGSSVDIIESKLGYRPKACILCEKDETLRYLVGEKHGISVDPIWQHSSKGGGAFYYAKDVDDLFVDNARLLREFAALCADCHFFVIGGSPCTDLTYAGGDQGFLGICGPASVFFFTTHLALHLLTTVIPGNRIRFLIENAGSMRTEHFRFMKSCLGLQHLQKNALTWCTSTLSPAKRLRIFFQNNTIPLMKRTKPKFTIQLI